MGRIRKRSIKSFPITRSSSKIRRNSVDVEEVAGPNPTKMMFVELKEITAEMSAKINLEIANCESTVELVVREKESLVAQIEKLQEANRLLTQTYKDVVKKTEPLAEQLRNAKSEINQLKNEANNWKEKFMMVAGVVTQCMLNVANDNPHQELPTDNPPNPNADH